MTVKDEAASILASLESIKPWIDYWVIVDLESRDNTVDLIRTALKEIPGELIIQPFINLEYNRNQALAAAKEKAEYILFLEATEQLKLGNFPSQSYPFQKEAYCLKIETMTQKTSAIRLVRSASDWNWRGIANPELFCPSFKEGELLDTFYLEKKQQPLPLKNIHPYAYKQLLSLHELLKRKPFSVRASFLIAQLYRDAQMPQRALLYYKRRAEAGGNKEEVFWSLYQIAQIQELLSYPQEEIAQSYYRAIHFRPSRVEPLYQLARCYRTQGNFVEGYLLAKTAQRLSPSKDRIPAIKWEQEWISNYGIWLECMLCSHYAMMHEEAIDAALHLLSLPHLPDPLRDIADNVLQATFLLKEGRPIQRTH